MILIQFASWQPTKVSGRQRDRLYLRTYSVIFTNGDEWKFDSRGYLAAARSGTTSLVYLRDAAERLVEISLQGTWIRLHYSPDGWIDRVQSSRGTEARYTYDSRTPDIRLT